MTKFEAYRQFCALRKDTHQLRILKETQLLPDGHAERDGATLVNFAGNDYLGLSQHPALIERARDYGKRYGAGSAASRLVTGNHPVYARLEDMLAKGKGQETALVMNGGYQANLTILAALTDPEVVGKPVTILADRLSHHSLLQGSLLGGARLARFHHNDYNHLEQLLQQHTSKGTQTFIVTESVFGMDGDRADLATLVQLAETYGAMLYVDEAHATGLFGEKGFGLAAAYKDKIDVVMGTFGKALGSFGAYIACAASLRDYLIQRCGGLIYSTALPPSVLGSIEAALELIPSLDQERAYVQAQAEHLRQALRQQGWNCGLSTTQIIPIILGHEEAATDLAETLKQDGFLLAAIRPPTVPRGTSRLRLSLSAAHKESDINRLITTIARHTALYVNHGTQALAS